MPAKPESQLVVRRRRPVALTVVYGLLAAAALVAVIAGVYRLGQARAGFLAGEAERQARELNQAIEVLGRQNSELREALARAERQLQIDKTAYGELGAALRDSTGKIAELREELSFYRSIISPTGNRRGVQVQDLDIAPTAVAGQYRYRVVVIQAYNHKRLVKGRLSLNVTGMRDGKEAVVRVPPGSRPGAALNFRYFQQVEGVVALPADFIPLQVKISVRLAGKGAGKVDRSFDWPQT